jgi:tetratricopeptide (TPR) repeat protein
MLKPSDALKKTLHDMGFESGEAALKQLGLEGVMQKLTVASKGSAKAFADWFPNVRAMNGALGISGKNVATLHQNLLAMQHSQGATAAAFAEQGKSIAVQWQKAKASLVAAAIPLGQLLFPALQKGAEWAQKFAEGLQSHMPEIKADFGELARLTGEVGQGLGRLALGPQGSSAIVGLLAGLGTAKTLGGVQNLATSMGKLNPAALVAAAGIGTLAAGVLYAWEQFHHADDAIRGVQNALQGLSGAVDRAKQAHLNLQQAQLNVDTTAREVTAAEHLYAQAVRTSGRNSDAARDALLALRQAQLSHRRALLDETTAQQQNTRAAKDNAGASRSLSDQVQELAVRHKLLVRSQKEAIAAGNDVALMYTRARNKGLSNAEAIKEVNRQLGQRSAAGFIADLLKLAGQLSNNTAKARLLAAAIAALPNHKNISVEIRTRQITTVETNRAKTIGQTSRAAGGFIPGPSPGAAVPILAHAGEVVLNRAQQEMLGGPRFLASMFGFTGDEGPQFASGGIVNRLRGRKPKPKPVKRKAPHHPLRTRAKAASKAGQQAVAAADAVYTAEQDLDRAYGQLSRQYSISPDAYGNTLDVNEIDSLIGERQKMLALIEQEKAKLQQAVETLKKAVAALLREIKSEKDAIARDLRQITAERRKKKPNRGLIDRLQADVSSRRTVVSDMQSTLDTIRGDVKTEQDRIDHGVDFDHRDVELDILELQQQRKDVLQAIKDAQAAGADTGGSTDTGGGPASTGTPGIDQGFVQQLLEQLGRYRLALGLQGVQVPVIGSFAKGTLTVPQTGLALVHAGETITPANRAGGDGGSIGDVHVSVVLEGDAAGLERFIKVKAVEATPAISSEIGRAADTRRRSGLWG